MGVIADPHDFPVSPRKLHRRNSRSMRGVLRLVFAFRAI